MAQRNNLHDLNPADRRLFEELLLEEGIEILAEPAIPRRKQDDELPLAYAQQRLWLLDQIEPANPAYNVPKFLRISGRLDIPTLERCLREIVRRHETLRTTFHSLAGLPAQVISPPPQSVLSITDLSDLPPAERDPRARQSAVLEASSGFDLKVDPPFRARLLKLAEEDHALFLTMHHICSDGWSRSVLLNELSQIYTAFSDNKPSPLPELSIQYADYALWEKKRLRGKFLDDHLSYWRRQLEGAPALLELPTDYSRPAGRTFYRGAYHSLSLSQDLSDAIKQLSLRGGATTFMTLLTAFKVLLYRYTGEADIVVGTPVSGRNYACLEPLIGCFLNMLALRTNLSGNPGFNRVLKLVRETCLSAFSHQDLPFERIIEELQPERSLSHSPVFQVLFNMQNFEEGEFRLPGLAIEDFYPSQVWSKFDLTLYATERASRIDLFLVYNSDLFAAQRMSEMLGQFELLLTQIVKNAGAPIDSFSLVTKEFAEVLPNPVQQLDPSSEAFAHEFFSRNARLTPDQVAVVDSRGALSYAELDEQSNRLANCLIAHNIRPHDVVAVFGHRSAALVWALLGTLKAGAAFLILDPRYPDSRLIEHLKTAKPRGWLHIRDAGEPTPALAEFVAQQQMCCHLVIDSGAVVADYSTDAPQVHIKADDPAYVTFTSGTTGVPRGICGHHNSLIHFPIWLQQTFGINPTDRFSMLSGLSHDPLLRDVFSPLQLGACLCIPDQDDIEVPGRLANWMLRERISVTNLTPAMGQILTVSAVKSELKSLRFAFFVGEALTKYDVSRLQELAPAATCVNLYGTTETQRALSYFVVPQIEKTKSPASSIKATFPVGAGITNVQLLILNRSRQLAGCGELGEIYFRSPHMAQGYLNDKDLTREHFLFNSFTADPGDRLYRTGDVGRYLPNGDAEIIGRADDQVKVRGFRVEPGEIETIVKGLATVSDCKVVQRHNNHGADRLVAYVVFNSNSATSATELRNHLKQHVPDYMIPPAFMFVDKIPLTPNGKVDLRALPDGAIVETTSDRGYGAPATSLEEALLGVWSQVLGVKNIGLHDDFFVLGGHSLMAMKLLSLIREMLHELHIDVPLRTLFEASTVSGFARRIEEAMQAGRTTSPPRVDGTSRNARLPLSLVQEGWLLREWWEQVHSVDRRSFHLITTMRLEGPLDLSILEQAVNEIIRRHEVLRSTFSIADGLLSQNKLFPLFRKLFAVERIQNTLSRLTNRISKIGTPAFLGGPSLNIKPEVVLPVGLIELQELDEQARQDRTSQLITEQLQKPFDYAHGPLLRATVLRLTPDEHVLCLVVHHLLADGWSMQIFLRELAALYTSYSSGARSPLPELPFQYLDFAAWQRKWFQGEVLESMIQYWRRQFDGVGLFPELTLPFIKKDPTPGFQRCGEVQSLTFSSDLSKSLIKFGYRQGVTMYMLFLAALKALLFRYTGREKISVFSPLANRSLPDAQGLIGWFANIHALTTDCSGNPSFSTLLKRIREVALGAYAHQEVPYFLLIKALLPEMKNYRMPQRIFEVPHIMFDFSMQRASAQKIGNLTTKTIEVPPSSVDAGIEVRVIERREGFKLRVKYSTEIAEAASIRRMLEELQALLECVVDNPEIRLRDLPVVST